MSLQFIKIRRTKKTIPTMKKYTRIIWSGIAMLIVCLGIMTNTYLKGRISFSDADAKAAQSFLSIQTEEGVKEIGFEEYVMGITAKQILPTANREARRAQMVLVRTNLQVQRKKEPDILPSFSYLTMEKLKDRGIEEVFRADSEATRGEILKVSGKKRYLPYHRVSAGKTRNGAEALPGKGYQWLKSMEWASDQNSPEYLNIRIIKAGKLQKKAEEIWPGCLAEEKSLISQLSVVRTDSAGYVLTVRVGNLELPGETFAKGLGLPSSCFAIDEVEDGIRITTKGVGHGLGLSQFQAQLMGEAGAGYEEILCAFFEDAVLTAEEDHPV